MFRAVVVALALALVATQAFAQKPGRVHADGLQPGATNGRFIVKYVAGSGIDTPAQAEQRLTNIAPLRPPPRGQMPVNPGYVVERTLSTGAFVVRTPAPMDAVQAHQWMQWIAGDFLVDFIEVDTQFENHINVANDTWYPYQRNLWSPWSIWANQAWDMSQAEGVVVGVIDTGFNAHPDMEGVWLPGYDFAMGGVENFKPACPLPHGTIVAGTAGALTNNHRGIAGVAPKVRIVPANVSFLCTGGANLSFIVEAIAWLSGGPVADVPANANPVEVINISLGSRSACSHSMQAAIATAVARGVTVVAAAGNDGEDTANVQPANCDHVIAVGGVEDDGSRSPASNWGPAVAIAAPYNAIWATPDDTTMIKVFGTSFSAPQVSGIVAMMQAAAKTPLVPSRIKTLLATSAKPFPNGVDRALGAGIANAPAAVSLARSENTLMLENTGYVIVARSLAGDVGPGCLSLPYNLDGGGMPFRFRGDLAGDVQTCGLGAGVLRHQRLIWDVTVVQHPQTGIKAHLLRSRFGGQCLIRSNRGYATQASMFLWPHGDNAFCGFPDLASLFDNGQALWHLDAPMERLVAGKRVVNAGLKMIRPAYAFLGLTGTYNDYTDAKEWDFEFHPVGGLPQASAPQENLKNYRIVNVANGECLDIPPSGVLRTWPCNGAANQKFLRFNWSFTQGYGCLDVRGERKVGNDEVILYGCHFGDNQKWNVDAAGRIVSRMAGAPYCMDLNTHAEDAVTMWECNDSTDQRFIFQAL